MVRFREYMLEHPEIYSKRANTAARAERNRAIIARERAIKEQVRRKAAKKAGQMRLGDARQT